MSRSSGLPFANNFVPGDNLFKDFEVNLSDARIVNEGPGDAHVLQNVRDVVLSISKAIQCTSCHSVHGESSKQHTRLAEQPICFACHTRGEPMARVKDEVRHSAVCEY